MKIGIIGTGSRTQDYIEAYRSGAIDGLEIAALADIDESRLRAFAGERFGTGRQPALYTDYREMLSDADIPAVIVCTPDTTHREIAVAAMQRGKHILLEKPIATTIEDCSTVYRESLKHDRVFKLAFGLRHSAFFIKIREIVSSGQLGKLLAIEATERLGHVHAASFFRRWQRFRKNSGGFLNYKCCHELDILNWITGLEPVALSAFGGRSFFNGKPEAADRCSACGLVGACDYAYRGEDYRELFGRFNSLEDLCVFNSGADIVDHETVGMQYENGVTASFTVSMLSAEANNMMTIFGSEATLSADMRKNEIEVKFIHSEANKLYKPGRSPMGSDEELLAEFCRVIESRKESFPSDARAGLLSSGAALLAERSMEHHKVCEVSELFQC